MTNSAGLFFLKRRLKDDSGQALPWMVFLVALFIGMAGLTLDLGRAYASYRELQTATDAAALAGAYAMSASSATQASVLSAVTAYSSATGGANANGNLPGVAVSTTFKCLTFVTNSGVFCDASPLGANTIQVVQTGYDPNAVCAGAGCLRD